MRIAEDPATMGADLLNQLRADERFKSVPYRDSRGLWTFATGRCLETNPLTGAEWKALLDAGEITVQISAPGGERLLLGGEQAAQLKCASTFIWWPKLNDPRRDVIAAMVYQMGIAAVSRFPAMLAACARGDFDAAADEMLDSDWHKQTPARCERLSHIMRTGVRP